MPFSYQELEKYPKLIDSLKAGNCALFVGAGLSVAAGFPTWKRLMQDMIDDLKARKEDTTHLEELLKTREYQKIAAIYREKVKNDYYEFLDREFHIQANPTDNHHLIAKLPFACVLTTNYDRLLEREYERQMKQTVRVYSYKSEDLGLMHEKPGFYIFKCHGDINDRDSIVLTKNDYERLIFDRIPYQEFLKTILQVRTLLFIGYSLNDLDFDLIHGHLRSTFNGKIPAAFSLMTGHDDEMSLLENDGITVIKYSNADGRHSEVTDFLRRLQDSLVERKPFKITKIPYKFLDCYYEEDKDWFFGREGDYGSSGMKEAIENPDQRIIHVVGENGIGKTSFMQALVIPELKKAKYTCFYVNTPSKIEDLRMNEFWDVNNSQNKIVVIIDHFDKILRQYKENKENHIEINNWKKTLLENLKNDITFIFVFTSDTIAPYFGKLFPNARAQIIIEGLEGERLRKAISEAANKLSIECGGHEIFGQGLVEKLANKYEEIKRNRDDHSQTLTYIQAVCYYLIKNGKYVDDEASESVIEMKELKDIILDNQIGNVVKNLCEKEDRIIFIELIKKMLEEKPDLLATLDRNSLSNLIRYQATFPEKIL